MDPYGMLRATYQRELARDAETELDGPTFPWSGLFARIPSCSLSWYPDLPGFQVGAKIGPEKRTHEVADTRAIAIAGWAQQLSARRGSRSKLRLAVVSIATMLR